MKALELKNLSKEFGGLKAVQSVDLFVDPNEVVGLIGPNGAGKTTIFNVLSGIYQPTKGSIKINGTDNGLLQAFQIPIKCRCARTFQNLRLFKNISVLDNVRVAAHQSVTYHFWDIIFNTSIFKKKEKQIYEESLELLKLFGLESKAFELACNLPYGDQRKLEIARALTLKPKILFLDEPAAGLNVQETNELVKLVRFVQKKFETAILVIEHDMKFIMNLCQRIYVLDHGQLIAVGSPKEIKKNPEVIKAYLGEETLTEW